MATAKFENLWDGRTAGCGLVVPPPFFKRANRGWKLGADTFSYAPRLRALS